MGTVTVISISSSSHHHGSFITFCYVQAAQGSTLFSRPSGAGHVLLCPSAQTSAPTRCGTLTRPRPAGCAMQNPP